MSSALAFQLWAWLWTLSSELAAVGLGIGVWRAIQRRDRTPARRWFVVVTLANLWVHPLFWMVHVQIRPYAPATLFLLEGVVVGLEALTYMAIARIPAGRAFIASLLLNLVSLTVGFYFLV